MAGSEHLYGLLPAIYRRRDAESGEALRALLSLIETEVEAVRADTETAYDNWFVETAEEWLVPYLASALRLPVTRDVEAIAFSRRAFVANVIRYRRAKGTAAALELLARDVTNYPARAVEFFRRLAWTEAINHQEGRVVTLDIRDTAQLETLSGPLGEQARRVDVRSIRTGRGAHNLPNVGLFMWRSQIFRLTGVDAAPVPASGDRGWQFRPTGEGAPLHAPLVTETDPSAVATAASVPVPLSRRRLWAQAAAAGAGMDWPFEITLRGTGAGGPETGIVAPDRIRICHLDPLPAAHPGDTVRVDPEAGVLLLGQDAAPGLTGLEVTTSHYIATPGLLGAGPWARPEAAEWLARWTRLPEGRTVGYQVMVLRGETGDGIVPDLETAIAGWHDFLDGLAAEERPRSLGLILIGDSRSHPAPATAVRMSAGAVLGIVAASWPEVEDPGGGPSVRPPGTLLADERRPLLTGDLSTVGEGTAKAQGELYVDGLVINGDLEVRPGSLDALALRSATLLGRLNIAAEDGANAALEAALNRTIARGVVATGPIASLDLSDSAVMGPVLLPGAALSATGATVLGRTEAGRIEATDCLFDAPLQIDAQQDGCLRFCYLPTASRTPRRYRCQPDTALDAAPTAAERARIAIRLRPQFRSRDPFAPGFLLFTEATPAEIARGAEDGGEVGCWSHLQHQTRVTNLANALPQFLRFGLEPGLIFLV